VSIGGRKRVSVNIDKIERVDWGFWSGGSSATPPSTGSLELALHTRTSMMRKCEITSVSLVVLCFLVLAGCDRMVTPPHTQLVKDADAKSAQEDFLPAISLYETALDAALLRYRRMLLYGR
jgi:hypothetical protein